MAQIVRVKNPRALMIPETQQLLTRMIEKMDGRIAPLGLGSIANELFQYVTSEELFILFAMEEGKLVGVLLAHFHQNNLVPHAMIDMIYNEGTPAAAKGLKEKALDIFTEAGYTKVWATSSYSGMSEKQWKRVMSAPGIEIQPVGTVFEIGVK